MADIIGRITLGDNLQSAVNSNVPTLNSDNVNQSKSLDGSLNQQGQSINSEITDEQADLNGEIVNRGNLEFEYGGTPQSGFGYVHIRYSHELPIQDSDMMVAPDAATYYIGFYSGNNSSPPDHYTAYVWSQFRGNDGEQGIQGVQGEKGDSGETSLVVVNPLHFEGYLNIENWMTDRISRDATFYYQVKEMTNQELINSTMTQEELIEYMNIKMTDRTTPLIDLVVSKTSITLGMSQMEQWKYLSRVYLTRDELEGGAIKYYMHFECYKQAPNIQLKYQVKVI